MKWLRTIVLFDQGDVIASSDWKIIHDSYVRSIQSIDYPEGTGILKLRRKLRDAGGQWSRNGVVFLKKAFYQHLCYQPQSSHGGGQGDSHDK